MFDETQIFLIFDGQTVNFNNLFNGGIRIADVGPSSPEPVYEYEEFSGSNGKRLSNLTYTGFPFVMKFRLTTPHLYDWRMVLSEMRTLLYRDKPYYIVYSREPGRRFKVLPQPWEIDRIMMQKGIFHFVFDVFDGHSESVSNTLTEFDLESEWQFSQGLLAEDYTYSHDTSRFSILNAGDFAVDPREHDLKIRIEGESDSNVTIFNRTTGQRFIYYPSLSTRSGDWIELDGVYPKKNGVNCGIDTNHGLITLAIGVNQIEIQNVSRVKSTWDFRFLYK
ncbi:hypothetical protein A5886_001799 [Enterococcus sp. 8G7_MSG3316]|uniref:Siphovirus-type tail component RIFT-related domain-containing protein n=1 Tax=Candidatus Enterococcus testudinis TaxID=1834191 RepID=A0A242A757_9ENTE|nr:phage tail domain-containing protein [Enterococcus sp. 8G7_MSG3316]OTN76720.1 hypothetical protein A5886_001799 [Enterococcus sp. 8G7_MSG3316]